MFNWSVSVTYVNLVLIICRMDMNVSGFSLWSGMMMSFCVWMICGVVDLVSHRRINGCNSCMWNLSVMSYFGVVAIIPMS